MATIRVAIDQCFGESSDLKTLNTFCEKLKAAGHTVTSHGRGPNNIQSVMKQSKNACDLMIQIVCGKCIGTWGDFVVGMRTNYYHAKQGGFAYYKCWDPEWKARREPRDNFSKKGAVKVEVDKNLGKTLPVIFSEYSNMFYGYGDNAEDLAKTFLNNYQGGSGDSSNKGQDAGSNVLDLMKQALSDLDPLGPQLMLEGDTVKVKRSNIGGAGSNILGESDIINNNITIDDYANNTPNSYNGYKDQFLVDRFGEIPLEIDMVDINSRQVLFMGQRGHNHQINVKVVANPRYQVGNWVSLNVPSFNYVNRPYIITKMTYDDELQQTLTLEHGPPSLYVEKQETGDTEEITEDTEETTDD